MTNFSKFFEETVKTAMRVQEAEENNDKNVAAYYSGRLDALRWLFTNGLLDTKK